MVTRKVARAADDGYRNPLVPGLRATADAERLAAALAWADARLEPPGPHPAVAAEPDVEEAIWLAFLLALADPDAHELHAAIVAGHPSWASGELPEIPGVDPRTVPAYRAWAERSGSQAAAFLGEPAWSPERRFGRVFERLALPGMGRGSRFELLVTLGAAERCEVAADGLHPGKEEDATTIAAKRVLVSGDRMLLERRAADLASGCGVRARRARPRARRLGQGRRPRHRGTGRDPLGPGPAVTPGDPRARPRRSRHRRRDRPAAARVLPRRGRPAGSAHAAGADRDAAPAARLGRGVPRRVRGRAARRRGVVEAARPRSSTSTASSSHPDRFRRGIAGRLLDALAEHEPDAERTTVATGAANPPARRLYEQRGFAPVEERVVSGSIRIVIYERRTPA